MGIGIAASFIIILFLEVSRYFRLVKKNTTEIEMLKNKLSVMEELLNK